MFILPVQKNTYLQTGTIGSHLRRLNGKEDTRFKTPPTHNTSRATQLKLLPVQREKKYAFEKSARSGNWDGMESLRRQDRM